MSESLDPQEEPHALEQTRSELTSEDYLAIGLSLFVFPGAGHVVIGQPEKGIGIVIGTIVLTVLIILIGTLTCGIGYIGFVLLPLIYFLAFADLWKCIETRKHRTLESLEVFPSRIPRRVEPYVPPVLEPNHSDENVDDGS